MSGKISITTRMTGRSTRIRTQRIGAYGTSHRCTAMISSTSGGSVGSPMSKQR